MRDSSKVVLPYSVMRYSAVCPEPYIARPAAASNRGLLAMASIRAVGLAAGPYQLHLF